MSCPRCVRYTSGPRAGEIFMRCLVCTTAALGGDPSSVRAAAMVTALAELVRPRRAR